MTLSKPRSFDGLNYWVVGAVTTCTEATACPMPSGIDVRRVGIESEARDAKSTHTEIFMQKIVMWRCREQVPVCVWVLQLALSCVHMDPDGCVGFHFMWELDLMRLKVPAGIGLIRFTIKHVLSAVFRPLGQLSCGQQIQAIDFPSCPSFAPM